MRLPFSKTTQITLSISIITLRAFNHSQTFLVAKQVYTALIMFIQTWNMIIQGIILASVFVIHLAR
jgi:hypothetical protein